MAQRSLTGLLLLFGLLLVIFRSIARPRITMRPKLNNNPFALIAPIKNGKPVKNNWRGLVGFAPDGFLTFQSPALGVRAGFINLYQTYIDKGLDTLEKIFPVYLGGVVDEKNNPETYIQVAAKSLGIGRDQRLTDNDIYKLGRVIEKVEQGGKWITDKEFDEGYMMAKAYLKK